MALALWPLPFCPTLRTLPRGISLAALALHPWTRGLIPVGLALWPYDLGGHGLLALAL